MLDSTLTATATETATDDDIALSYTVENVGADPIELSFRDGQRAEYVAERDGDEVWRYGDDRMFAMALGTVELAPGAAETFTAEWSAPPAGEYTLRAWLTADDATAEATTTVTVA